MDLVKIKIWRIYESDETQAMKSKGDSTKGRREWMYMKKKR